MGWFLTGVWSTCLLVGWVFSLYFNSMGWTIATTVLGVITAFCIGMATND